MARKSSAKSYKERENPKQYTSSSQIATTEISTRIWKTTYAMTAHDGIMLREPFVSRGHWRTLAVNECSCRYMKNRSEDVKAASFGSGPGRTDRSGPTSSDLFGSSSTIVRHYRAAGYRHKVVLVVSDQTLRDDEPRLTKQTF